MGPIRKGDVTAINSSHETNSKFMSFGDDSQIEFLRKTRANAKRVVEKDSNGHETTLNNNMSGEWAVNYSLEMPKLCETIRTYKDQVQ